MLARYIRVTMEQAQYEILEDQSFYGEIPGFNGVYANANTLQNCRELLKDVLEGWLILGLYLDHSLPKLSKSA